MTSKDIIKLLPFEKDYQNYLLNNFDTFSPDQRLNIEGVLWDAYCAIYKLELQEKLELALMKASANQEPLDGDILKRAREETNKVMKTEFHTKTTSTDLDRVRAKLQAVMDSKTN